ncbi:MAG: ABC transporter ATP-binding protein [Deltaproteobacteria bacterium]|nr:ABC transporter ATP-binding protein [Deltaproteobacteria bacterium]
MAANENTVRAAEVQALGLAKAFGYPPYTHQVLADCSFTLRDRELTVLIGPSGCGKSTLINLLAGYDKPDQGQLLLNGQPISGPGADRLVVFQETALFPWMTTYTNVAYGPRVSHRMDRATVESRVAALLDKVGLAEFRHKYPSQLSGGMQRRGELARLMINDPAVMILDEPFRGLDAMTRELMQEYFVTILEERSQTVLFVTSEIDEAIFLADRLLIMSNRPGRIIKEMIITLPRPRHKDLLQTEEYFAYKREALEVLHAEALKAFAGGSKAAQDFLEAFRKEQVEQ